MKRLSIVLLLVCSLAPLKSSAQRHDFGGLVNLEFEQKVAKGFDFNMETEARFNRCFTSFDRLKIGASFDYSFLKKKRLKINIGANYLLYNDLGTAEHRGRIIGALSYTEKIKNFKLSYRVRVQSTFYDELRGEHEFNPKTYLRNRLQLAYGFKQKSMEIYASTEFFLRLYQKGNYFVDNFRTIVGWNYKLNKGSHIGIFFRVDNEIQVKNPENMYYFGLRYGFKN